MEGKTWRDGGGKERQVNGWRKRNRNMVGEERRMEG